MPGEISILYIIEGKTQRDINYAGFFVKAKRDGFVERKQQ